MFATNRRVRSSTLSSNFAARWAAPGTPTRSGNPARSITVTESMVSTIRRHNATSWGAVVRLHN